MDDVHAVLPGVVARRLRLRPLDSATPRPRHASEASPDAHCRVARVSADLAEPALETAARRRSDALDSRPARLDHRPSLPSPRGGGAARAVLGLRARTRRLAVRPLRGLERRIVARAREL